MQVFDLKGKSIQLGSSVGQGGEATVYRVNGRAGQLAKIYEPAPRANYPHKLGWMLSHPPANPTQASHHPSLAWPTGLLYDGQKNLAGYLMPHIQGAIPVLEVFNPRRRAKILPGFDRRYLHRAARNLAAAIGALHFSGYVVGDLNESNILVTPSALVTLIDTDSFQVEEQRDDHVVLHSCPVGKVEYTPPELQGQPLAKVQRLPEQDAFGLGVLIFQLLMGGSHPFRAQWLAAGDPPPIESRIAQGGFPYTSSPPCPVLPPKNARDLTYLHPELAELVRRCFVDGHREPSLRPAPQAWERAIAEAEQALVACPRGHYYSNHLPACPHCPASTAAARPSGSARPDRRAPAQSPGRGAQAGKPAGSPNRWGWGTWTGRPANPVPGNPQAAPQPAGPTPAKPRPNPAAPGTPPNRSRPAVPPAQPASAAPNPRPAAQAPRPASNPAPSRPNPAARTQSAPNWRSWWIPRPIWQSGPAGPAGIPWGSGSGSATRPSRPATSTRPAWSFGLPQIRIPNSAGLWTWARPRLFKSLVVGAGLGAVAGAVPGAVTGLAAWSAGEQAAWPLLWALGGVTGGLLRGWKPGYRLSEWIRLNLGWQRFWPLAGMLVGAFLGGVVSLAFLWWLIFPVFLGMFFGGRFGLQVGRKIWRSGAHLGWERIWASGGALLAALAGGLLARSISGGALGSLVDGLTGQMVFWMTAQQASWGLIWVAIGALAGAFGGAIGGFFADLFARAAGLID